jgi:hypothetical protein
MNFTLFFYNVVVKLHCEIRNFCLLILRIKMHALYFWCEAHHFCVWLCVKESGPLLYPSAIINFNSCKLISLKYTNI